MSVSSSAFEVWRDPTSKVEFYFSHSDESFTTGVMYIPPGSALPKHNRPKAFENLIQISGTCSITVFKTNDTSFEKILKPGDSLRMEQGQYHVHSNPYAQNSYTLFKAEGDITDVMKILRSNFERVE
jgi:quercetin dioxygenase-like cupin family protein